MIMIKTPENVTCYVLVCLLQTYFSHWFSCIFHSNFKNQCFHCFHCAKTIFPKSWNIMESSKRLSKYHLSINFLAQKKTLFPISEKFKIQAGRLSRKKQFLCSKIQVFISQVNHKKKKVLPILYCLFIYSQNNRRLCLVQRKLVLSSLVEQTGYNTLEKWDKNNKKIQIKIPQPAQDIFKTSQDCLGIFIFKTPV